MKKRLYCLFLTVVMIFGLAAGLNHMTVYAYEDDDPRISFDANGGTGEMETVYMNGNYPLPECTFTPPEGYRFKCWHRDGDIRELQPGDTVYVSNSNTVVSAVWEPIPAKVIFDPGSGTGSMDEVAVFGDYVLPQCLYIAPDGLEFQGWQMNGQQFQPGESIYVDDILTVTALWKELSVETPADTEPADTVPVPTETPIAESTPNSEQSEDLNQSNGKIKGNWYWIIIIGVMVALLCVACIGIVVLVVILIKIKRK